MHCRHTDCRSGMPLCGDAWHMQACSSRVAVLQCQMRSDKTSAEWACVCAEDDGHAQVLKPRDCVAMVIIMCGLLIVVVDRYRRERQRLADAADRGEYEVVATKESDAADGDVELALTGGSATVAGAAATAARVPARRSIEIPVVAMDGHVPIDAGMLIATALPSGGLVSRTQADVDKSWRIGTGTHDTLKPLRPERELIPISNVAS